MRAFDERSEPVNFCNMGVPPMRFQEQDTGETPVLRTKLQALGRVASPANREVVSISTGTGDAGVAPTVDGRAGNARDRVVFAWPTTAAAGRRRGRRHSSPA